MPFVNDLFSDFSKTKTVYQSNAQKTSGALGLDIRSFFCYKIVHIKKLTQFCWQIKYAPKALRYL